jgi:endoglucanase
VTRSAQLYPFALLACCLVPAAACTVLFPSEGEGVKPGGFEVHPVRVNSVGYLVGREKLVTIVLPTGTATLTNTAAEVRKLADDSVAAPCELTGPLTDAQTGDKYYLGTFTSFDTPGEYYVRVPGLLTGSGAGKSAPFHIGTDLYRDVLVRTMIGFYGQRCGTAVSITLDGDTFSHGVCHQTDARQKYLPPVSADTIKDSKRGWHDAGDYGKYVTNGAFTVGMMLDAWQMFEPALAGLELPIPEKGGAMPDYLDEVKWELDWLLTTQREDGAVSHKVTALAFEGFVMPEADGAPRYFTDVGTSATADFVATMAEAARVYQPFDAVFAAECLAAAELGYTYLQANPDRFFPDNSTFSTGGYGDGSDAGERLWAAVEMWETTGRADVLADVEARIWNASVAPPALRAKVMGSFDWDDANNLGLFGYLLSKRGERNPAIVAALTANAIEVADDIARVAAEAPYGRAIPSYNWGSNGRIARAAMNLAVANALAPAPRYPDAIAFQMDHLLGRNYYDRAQITAVGYHPPMRPHHRPSVADVVSNPWPGLLVGGPRRSPTDWIDNQESYDTNEIAINWSGSLVFATAALLPSEP